MLTLSRFKSLSALVFGIPFLILSAHADCISKNTYTAKKKAQTYLGGVEIGGFSAGLLTVVALTTPEHTDANPNARKDTEIAGGVMFGAGVAYTLAQVARMDHAHHHSSEEILVEAENGVGKNLDHFIKAVQKKKDFSGADPYQIIEILKAGNELEFICNPKIYTEKQMILSVQSKIASHWHPADTQSAQAQISLNSF